MMLSARSSVTVKSGIALRDKSKLNLTSHSDRLTSRLHGAKQHHYEYYFKD